MGLAEEAITLLSPTATQNDADGQETPRRAGHDFDWGGGAPGTAVAGSGIGSSRESQLAANDGAAPIKPSSTAQTIAPADRLAPCIS